MSACPDPLLRLWPLLLFSGSLGIPPVLALGCSARASRARAPLLWGTGSGTRGQYLQHAGSSRTRDQTCPVLAGRFLTSRPPGKPHCFLCVFYKPECTVIICGRVRAALVALMVKSLPAMQETRVRYLGQEDPPEKEMATHSSVPA